jgi:hypothetical protein
MAGVFSQEQISQPGGATGSGLMRTSTGALSFRTVGRPMSWAEISCGGTGAPAGDVLLRPQW